MEIFDQKIESLLEESFMSSFGTVQKVRRDSVKVMLPKAKVGALCKIESEKGSHLVEIVSLDPEGHVGMPLETLDGVQLNDRVILELEKAEVPVGNGLLGKVIDSMGVDYDSHQVCGRDHIALYGSVTNPLSRVPIREPIDLGVKAINGILSCGRGQRQGIFAGSGVGKSILMGMISRFTSADVVVIGLIGERGREVREFLDESMGPEGRKKSVVVVETADRSAVRRVRGAYAATAVAEYFRMQGKQVLLMMDSLTRFAMAQREIGLAAGEPPTSKGYTPSVFSHLSKLVERAGNWGKAGSITGIYTVLVEGDDLEDPIADSSRAILDGHIVLSRKLANRGHYPAIDILQSVSRVMDKVISHNQLQNAKKTKEILARYLENEDAIQYGMYTRGSDPLIDEAINLEPRIVQFLRQDSKERVSFTDTVEQLHKVLS